MGWIETNLKAYIEVESGAAFKSEEFVESGIPVVKIANISNYTLVPTKGDSFIKETDLEKYQNVVISTGDVLIAMSGNTTCKMGRVPESFSPSLVNQRVGWIKPISDEIDINFVYHLLISDTYQKRLWNYATATGQPNLSPRDIKRISFVKPPKPEQTAIATLLSKVDEAIAATQNSIKAAEKLKKALMQNLLTGKLKSDGTWRSEDEFYEDEKFGKVPKGWEVKKLGQLGSFMNGVNFSNSQLGKGYPFINLKDIYNNKIIDCSKLDKVEINKLNGLELFKGDIVFVRSSVKPSGIGWSALFNGNTETTIFCGFVIKYTFDQSIIKPEYLIELLLSEPIRNKIIALGQVVANTNINQRALKGLSIFFPKSIDEQKEIYSKLNSIDDEILDKQIKIQTLQRLKKSLMQNLLTGKVRLPQEFIAQFEEAVEEVNKTVTAQ